MQKDEKQNLILPNVSDESLAFLSQDKYSMDSELDNKYKNLTKPVGSRLKNALLYNTCIVFGIYYFSRNIVYFRNKRSGGIKHTTYFKILRTIFFYTFIPTILLLPNIFILFGLHPVQYFKDKKELEEDLLGSSELRDAMLGITKMYKKDIASTLVEGLDNKI